MRVRGGLFLVLFAVVGALYGWTLMAGINIALLRAKIVTTNIMEGWPGLIACVITFTAVLALEIFLVTRPIEPS